MKNIQFTMAKGTSQINDVILFYGKKIKKTIKFSEEIEENYIFNIDKDRYFGGTFDIINDISGLLGYTFDQEWFMNSINNAIDSFNLDKKIEKVKNNEPVCLIYIVPIKN